MVTQESIVKIERHSCGYSLTIDDWFIDSFWSLEKLIAYLSSRIRTDFN